VRRFRPDCVPWRFVTPNEFDKLIKCYPRPLVTEPPLHRKSRCRRYFDPTRGCEPHEAVAVANTSRRAGVFEIRTDVPDWHVGTENTREGAVD
jgi:hypothetical protein